MSHKCSPKLPIESIPAEKSSLATTWKYTVQAELINQLAAGELFSKHTAVDWAELGIK